MNQRKYSVNYNKLKINISKSCRAKRNGNKELSYPMAMAA